MSGLPMVFDFFHCGRRHTWTELLAAKLFSQRFDDLSRFAG
jgi:hypothetical protein